MRKRSVSIAFVLLVCCAALLLVAARYRTQAPDVCVSLPDATQTINTSNSHQVWESLSNQFVSAIHF